MIPRRKRGRQSEEAQRQFEADLGGFIDLMLEINERVGFKMSSRGWCYALEEYGLGKGEFDTAQKVINDCRKNGLLPNGFIAEDTARSFNCIEREVDETSPEEEAQYIIDQTYRAYLNYYPISFWAGQPYYIQMLVEKIDLKSLFEPICRRYAIPIASARGWSAIRQRKELVKRFKDCEARGQTPVLLYAGDHDPVGLRISDFLKSHLQEIYRATGWLPTNLIIDRFGLNYDFIMDNNLSWIPNLETGRKGKINDLSDPRHRDHHLPYVQDYLRQFGPKKVEANAIVVAPEMGRKLVEETIGKYIDPDDLAEHHRAITELQQEVKEHVLRLMTD